MNDDLLERLANYYTSEYVTKNMPYLREIPFHEWLRRKGYEINV